MGCFLETLVLASSMKRTISRALIALNLDALNVAGLVTFTRGVAKGITNNVNLTAADIAKLPIAVVDLLAAATSLETIHTNRPTNPSKANTKLERDQSNLLMNHLTDTAAFIEGLANTKAGGDVTLAESIIVSFGFQLKKPGTKPAKVFSADSPAKNTAHVHVPADLSGAVRLVRYSMDGGKTFSGSIVVHGTVVIFNGFKSTVEVAFQMAKSTPPLKRAKLTITVGNEEPVWSDSVTCVIT